MRDISHYQVFDRKGRRRLLDWFLAAACTAIASTAAAQLQLPDPVGYVNDFAEVLSPAEEDRIGAIIDEVRTKSGGEIVVVTQQTLGGRSRDEVALQIGRQWLIGQRGEAGDRARNTGVVILVVPPEREWKIETGSGSMVFIPAAEAGRIGREYMLPSFQAGDYATGLLQAVTVIAQAYAQQFDFQLTGEVPELAQPSTPRLNLSRLVPLFILLIIILSMLRRGGGGGFGGPRGGRRMRHVPVVFPFPMGGSWGRGGFGGGGFGGGGFGGGGFGGFGGGGGFTGGGAGGRW
jgi:uncharacterized protein